ncbi:hypothetical protein [Nitrosopumilus sp.]|uniref:hypothetical protein n=1 Tax=Nitrosopumilus sp. TaxID=2024843 RepID=UPI00247E4D3D|nr:hypothetical protein [Nitrosopumilus sp.]MCV0430040.1 hypothetical protein [Nitrosopumilus sp.]
MSIFGDLVELTDDESVHQFDEKTIESIPWELHEGIKIPSETCSLYSIGLDHLSIDELPSAIFEIIKKSSFSHIYPHIYPYDELLILFFEFAIEKDTDQFEFGHFGIVPASDFFNALNDDYVIKIRDKKFKLKKSALKKILEKVTEFKNQFPNNSLL